MRKPTPKTNRKLKRLMREQGYIDGIRITKQTIGKGSRVKKLPPYDEYNPNRVHVARRRKAWKEHTAFPRGWKVEFEQIGDLRISKTAVDTIVNGGWTTMTKVSEEDWTIEGNVYI